ncbi:MAG: hypothetical protein CMO01_08740 [Thalassobius sp.]|nr:hypothetical protein [Thalassovita sp.]
MQTNSKKTSIIRMLDEFRSIAQTGINHTDGVYDKERYHRMLELLANEYADISNIEPEEIHTQFSKELGYITPKVGVNSIICNSQGEMLLEHRVDDDAWGLPGGWAEPGETPYNSMKREIFEETGLNAQVKEIIHIFTRYPGEFGLPHTIYLILFYCEVEEGEIKLSVESQDISFQKIDTIKEWHFNHQEMAEAGLKYWEQHIKKDE